MFALQVTFDEKNNKVTVHGHGRKTTKGEKAIVAATVSSMKSSLTEVVGVNFTSDVKIKAAKSATLPTATSTEGLPPEIAALLSSLGAGSVSELAR